MVKLLSFYMFAALLCLGQFASANVEVRFIESAPKDRFEIKNMGECLLEAVTFNIDLSTSAGQLIFDTTATGAGVEVFQPFEMTAGSAELINAIAVADGDKQLSLMIKQLAPSEVVSFTIDVDDTLRNSELGQIRVAQSEMQGGVVTISTESLAKVEAAFTGNSKAILPTSCTSV